MVWATSKMIRVAYYTNLEKNESQKICFIELPQPSSDSNFPTHLIKEWRIANTKAPSILILESKQIEHDEYHPRNITFITSWYNQLKIIELIYNEKEDKFKPSIVHKKNIQFDGNFSRFISSSCLFDVSS